ncbi:hypothetical protein [Nocardia farcinica]|nr:hypothetical protein [Nocardia farcinica]
MSLKRYEVEVNGHKTVLQLSDEDAKDRGLTAADEVKARPAANKAARAANKGQGATEGQ